MPTIGALVEGKQLGTVKVTRPGWHDCWFRPCYVTAPDSGKLQAVLLFMVIAFLFGLAKADKALGKLK